MFELMTVLEKAWEIETALRLVGIQIQKAKYQNLLEADGFDAAVIGMLDELQKVVVPEEKKALAALLSMLDAQWVSMPPELRTGILNTAAQKYLNITNEIPKIAVDTLAIETKHVVGNTKSQTASKYALAIDASLSLEDETITEAIANHQSHYIKDQYGKRVEAHSKLARNIVASGSKNGLDPSTIAKQLESQLSAQAVQRSKSYWEMVASTYCARGRTYGELRGFADAGFTEFEFEAVLDEVTTDVCRFMHGKVFSVDAGLARYQQVAESNDPESVKWLQPWVQTGKDGNGELGMYYRDETGSKNFIATIVESGVGAVDTLGSYANEMSPRQLQSRGISAPPLHGRCRSTLVPR